MIKTKFRRHGPVMARYVGKGFVPGEYRWCEQSASNPAYDVAQGTCEADDLPDDIRAKADAYDGCFYACEWPLTAESQERGA